MPLVKVIPKAIGPHNYNIILLNILVLFVKSVVREIAPCPALVREVK